MAELKHLFQPIRIGNMTVKNRVMMPGMAAGNVLDDERHVTPEMTAYFVERARSRPGMMAIGTSMVSRMESAFSEDHVNVPLFGDEYIDSIKGLVDAVHQYDTKFGIQLYHGGSQAPNPGVLFSPSGIPPLATMGGGEGRAKEMSLEDISKTVEDFGSAAGRCLKAGFDFVEIHAAHGYLINQFLTPYFNRRADEYGGSFENRARFLLDILREVRKRVGADLTVGIKINGEDYIRQGGSWTLEDTCRIAPMLEEEGCDYITVSAGVYGSYRLTIPPMYEPQGCYTHMSQEVKKHVSVPVMAIGRIKDPVMADRLIKEGKADIVCMGRAHIADPQIVEKARNGQLADIRPCLADCRGCIDQHYRTAMRGEIPSISCVVNPRAGRESICSEIEGEKKDNPRKVLVAGAGYSGMEVARRAAFSGHQVILCESRGWMGGQLKLAAMMPGRQEIGEIISWYERQLNKLGVEVCLNTIVDDQLLDQMNPDVVVVATGSLPKYPQGYIDGLEHVEKLDVLMVDDLLEDKLLAGDIVLVIGGDQIGMQVADYLAGQGKKVCVVEPGTSFAEKLAANDKYYLIGKTIEKGVRRIKNVWKVDILPGEDIWIESDKGKEHLPEIDTIVLASQRQPNRYLAEIAEKKGIEIHILGDANTVTGEDSGTLMTNIAAAYDLGRRI